VEHGVEFTGSHLVLMDLHERHLDIMHQLGRQMVASAGVEIEIHQTTQLAEAIEGADFVLTTFRPGFFEARALDETIPLQYGVIGQETVGPGGFFMALRSIYVIREIVALVESSAPDAFLLNYTNPTNIVTEAIAHNSRIRVIGLCDQVHGDKRRLAQALGLDAARIAYRATGLNHATWSTHFSIDGQDGIPLLLQEASRIQKDPVVPKPIKRILRLALTYARIPNRYLQYYYFHDEMLEEALSTPRCRAEEIMAELPGLYTHYEDQSREDPPNVIRMRGGSTIFGDFAVDLIRAISGDANSEHILNVTNHGALPGFDHDRVVEVPCRVNASGAHPLDQDPMAAEGMELLETLAEYQKLAAAAAWEGDREAAIHALTANPLIHSGSLARVLYDELAEAHRAYLPDRLLRPK
jgi:6-phospho-beta-glucosidase